MTGPRRNAAARWLPTPSPTARRLRYTSTPTPTMPSMLPLCSPAAGHLVTWSNTTSRRQRMRKNRRAHSLPLISPGHHPPWETSIRVDPLGQGRVRFVEGKAAGPEPGGKADAFGGHLLARLVLRPAVEFGRAKALRRALAILDRMPAVAPPVVAVDRGREAAVVVTVDMNSRLQGQAHADKSGLGRIAEAQPRHREHLVGQDEDLTNG